MAGSPPVPTMNITTITTHTKKKRRERKGKTTKRQIFSLKTNKHNSNWKFLVHRLHFMYIIERNNRQYGEEILCSVRQTTTTKIVHT